MSNGGAAAKAGVRVNDVVVSLDGSNSSVAYKDLVQIIGALGRPVVVGFQRGSGDAGGGAGGARGQEAGPLQRAQDAARRKMDELKGPPQVRRVRGAALLTLGLISRQRLTSREQSINAPGCTNGQGIGGSNRRA